MDQRNKWRDILGELNASAMSKTENALVKAYRNAIKDIKVQAKGFIEEYDTLSFSKRIEVERLLSVGQEIQAILEGTNKIVTQTIAESTGNMAQNGYYSTFYGLEGEYGLNVPMSFLDEDYIKSVVNSPVDGKTLSQRLYKNTNQLARTTTQSLIQGAIDGKGYKYVAKRIEDLTEADYKKALRIARTEGGRASSLSQQKAYEEAQSVGVKLKKRWLSTLDEATRNSHRLLDGQTVEAEEAFVSPETGAIGQGPRLMGRASEDINCRCTTIAVVDGYEPELRLDNETGEMVKNMSYTEWQEYKGIIPSTPKAGQAVVAVPAPVVPVAPAPEPIPDTPRRGHLRRRDEQGAINTISQELNISTAEAKQYRDSVYHFTTDAYSDVRVYQKNGTLKRPEISQISDKLEEYIAKAPKWEGKPLYRGVSLNQSAVEELKIGTVLRQGGTSSWTDDVKIAKIFTEKNTFGTQTSVLFRVEATNQGTSVRHISKYFSENEVVISKKAKHEIYKIEKSNGGKQLIVYLKELEE